MQATIDTLKQWARAAKRDVMALWLAARHTRVPLLAKCAAGVVAAYALSPIDLIPDFIPVLGYLDDLLLVPLGIVLAIKLIPADVLAELREQAAAMAARPVSRTAATTIVIVWIALAAVLGWVVVARLR